MKIISLSEYKSTLELEPDPAYKAAVDRLDSIALEAEFLQFMTLYATRDMPFDVVRNYRYLISKLMDVTKSPEFRMKLRASRKALDAELRKVKTS